MYRNNGVNIAIRLFALREFLYDNADETHAIKFEKIREFYFEKQFKVEKEKEKDEEKKVSKNNKMIYSDLHALQMAGVEIEYSERAKGWILYNPPFKANEVRLIIDSVQASKFITQKKAASLTKKITENFGGGRRQNLNRHAYVYDRIRSQNDEVVGEIDRIHEAIAANRKISFRYFHYAPDRNRTKKYSKSGEDVVVSPFALYWSNGNIYLNAYDGKKMRFYRVDRMESISSPKREKREGNDLFDAKDLTRQNAKVFDMYSTGKVYNVKFRCSNHIASSVIDQFGKDVMMRADDAEHFTFTQPVDISPPFFAWVATFGRSIKIISPEPVVKEMRSFLQKSMDMYKNDGNT